jgi:microcompartment protein CcmK/EutM
MKIARVIGSVTGTVKDSRLVGQKLLLVDIVDARGAVLNPSQVITDTCGAGVGDMVYWRRDRQLGYHLKPVALRLTKQLLCW